MKPLVCAVLLLAAVRPACVLAGLGATEVTLDYIAKEAEQRAHKPYRSRKADLPEFLRAEHLDYDKYRQIEFRHDKALVGCRKTCHSASSFFIPAIFTRSRCMSMSSRSRMSSRSALCRIFSITRGLHIPNQIPADTGYAGFRILYRAERGRTNGMNWARFWARVIFGCWAKASVTACRRAGWRWIAASRIARRNFPFSPIGGWANRIATMTELRLYAILDSVSCAGAYEFLIRPAKPPSRHRSDSLFPRDGQSQGGGCRTESRSKPSASRR